MKIPYIGCIQRILVMANKYIVQRKRGAFLTIFYQGRLVDVWKISKDNNKPEWVKKCFENNSMIWYDNRLKILVTAIEPSAIRDVKLGLLDTVLGYYGGGFVMGNMGDFFDATNGVVVSKKKFYEHYIID